MLAIFYLKTFSGIDVYNFKYHNSSCPLVVQKDSSFTNIFNSDIKNIHLNVEKE